MERVIMEAYNIFPVGVDKCLMDSLDDKWLYYQISNSFGGFGVCWLGVLISLCFICPKGLG